MERVTLEAQTRTERGKEAAKRLRRDSLIPAVVYGHGMTPLSLTVSEPDMLHVLHTKAGENVVIHLKVKGVKLKESTCLIKEIQHHPVTDKIDHVDFTVISMTEKITVKIPLLATHIEESAGVKESGVLDVVHHELEIECLPTQIPEKITFNVKDMKIGDSIHLKDLDIPEGVTCKLDPEEVVIALHPPRKEEELQPAGEGEIQEPEVIEKGKKAAEGEEGEAEAPAKKPEAKEAAKPAPEKKEAKS